jgi:hypothetical protein
MGSILITTVREEEERRKREPGSSLTHEAGAAAQGRRRREPGGSKHLCYHGCPRHREAGAGVARVLGELVLLRRPPSVR